MPLRWLSASFCWRAGLLIRGVQAAHHHDPGYRLDQVTVATLDLPASAYGGERVKGKRELGKRSRLGFTDGFLLLETKSRAELSGERVWHDYARGAQEPERGLERAGADIPAEVRAEVGPVREVEGLEEEA